MKNNTLAIGFLLLFTILFQNCGKDDAAPSYISIAEYISQNNLTPTYTSTGLGYTITNTGDSLRATDMSTLKGEVIVKTTDNATKIDTDGDFLYNPSSIGVSALSEAIQLIGVGGSITAYAPYDRAWGTSIPQSADVIMELTLTEILPDVETYITNNGLTITDTTSNGTYVLIEEEGDGTFPTSSSTVTVKYSGYYTNGDKFDSNANGLSISLGRVIKGWTEGIPKFSKGGKGKLFVPYESAYGTTGSAPIPGRTDIIFDIELVDFQ